MAGGILMIARGLPGLLRQQVYVPRAAPARRAAAAAPLWYHPRFRETRKGSADEVFPNEFNVLRRVEPTCCNGFATAWRSRSG